MRIAPLAMSKFAWVIPAACCLASICSSDSFAQTKAPKADTLTVGDEAPRFVLRDMGTDEPVFLRDYTGKKLHDKAKTARHIVVLSFWATWCQPCKVEIPILTKMAEQFSNDPVKIFLVNTLEQQPSTEDTVRATYASRGYTLPCLLDGSGRAAMQYGAHGLPMIVVIDKFGIIRKINKGFHEDFQVDVEQLITRLVNEDAPASSK
jgi:thiol-disulfide isomerase/thioredoxin